ncbi:MAG: hypothetical protein ABR562_00995, partial [Thermoplasmatota archaeon]
SLKGPGIGLTDVLRATEYVVPSIEIVDARMVNPRKIFDTISDNGAAAGIVVGAAAGMWLAWRHRERITHRHRAVLAMTWERVALAIVGLGVLLLVGAVVAPTQVRIMRGWLQGGLRAAEDLEQAPSWTLAVLFAVEVLAVGIFVLALGRLGARAFHWLEERAKRPP